MLRSDPAQVDTVVRRLSRRPTVLEGAVRKVTVLVLVVCVGVFAVAAGIAFLMNQTSPSPPRPLTVRP